MSGSATFTRVYKIPRKQGGGKDVVDKKPSTSSPLSKKVTNGKPSAEPQTKQPIKTTKVPVNNQSKFQNHPSSSSNQQRNRNNQPQIEASNKQKTAKRRIGENEQNVVSTSQKHPCHRPNTSTNNVNNPTANVNNDDPMELLDRIWQQMDDADRKKDDDQQRDGSMSPTASPFLQASTPIPSIATIKLTRYELLNAPRDDTIFRSFLSKPGLMERILGYKMQNARVDTYEVMKNPAKLQECETIESDDVDYGVPAFYSPEPSPSTSSHNTYRTKRRGPQTPPGSPNHEQDETALSVHSTPSHHSRIEERIEETINEPSSYPTHTMQRHRLEDDNEFSSRAELLQTFSQATNTPVSKLEEMIGADLQHAIGRVAKSVLLNTLKDAIRNVSSMPNSSKSTPLNRLSESGATFSSPVILNDMQCSSTDSNASANECSSSLILPPPPEAPKELQITRPQVSTIRPEKETIQIETTTNNKSSRPLRPNVQIRPPIRSTTHNFTAPLPLFNELPPIASMNSMNSTNFMPPPLMNNSSHSQLMRPPHLIPNPRVLLDTSRPPPNINKLVNIPTIMQRPPIMQREQRPQRMQAPTSVSSLNQTIYPPVPFMGQFQFNSPPPKPIINPNHIQPTPLFQAPDQAEESVFNTLLRSIGARDSSPQPQIRPFYQAQIPRRP